MGISNVKMYETAVVAMAKQQVREAAKINKKSFLYGSAIKRGGGSWRGFFMLLRRANAIKMLV